MATHNGDTMDECVNCGQIQSAPDCDANGDVTLTVSPRTIAAIQALYRDLDKVTAAINTHIDAISAGTPRDNDARNAFDRLREEKSFISARIVGYTEAIMRMNKVHHSEENK